MTFLLATLIPFLGVTLAAPSLQFRQVSNTTAASNGTRAGGATTELTFSGAGASFNVTAPLDGSSFIVRTCQPPLASLCSETPPLVC